MTPSGACTGNDGGPDGGAARPYTDFLDHTEQHWRSCHPAGLVPAPLLAAGLTPLTAACGMLLLHAVPIAMAVVAGSA